MSESTQRTQTRRRPAPIDTSRGQRLRRSVYGLAASTIVLAVLLHAPWTGYTTHVMPEKVDTLTLLASCPDIGRASEAGTTHEQIVQRFEANLACAAQLRPVPVPIKVTRWRTKEPAFHAVSRLRNVAAGIVLVLLLTGVFAWVDARIRKARSSRSA